MNSKKGGEKFFKTYRKIMCRHYSICLSKTIEDGLSDFTCDGCFNYEEEIPQTNLEAEWLLLWGIFKPELLKKYRELNKNGERFVSI